MLSVIDACFSMLNYYVRQYTAKVLNVGTSNGYLLWILDVGTYCGYLMWVLDIGTCCGFLI